MTSSSELRQRFLSFFEKKGHKIAPSSSLLPADPSVLFTTAGMQQFKEYFLGKESPFGNKVASCQKCFRTSDIEEVGDKNHLTFLEMLGNFSFNDYFKEKAIKLAYEFIFQELKLPKDKAIITVFKGDKEVPFDKESFLIWKNLGISEKAIKRCGRADNFWGPTGDQGPCGPTTEIYFGDTEVWNLVFNEYYQDKNNKLTLLKQKGVDTGMGLERLAMICQGKSSVYETDLFSPIIKEIKNSEFNKRSEKIIADHIRGAVFLTAEGIFPSNIERGYVLRRVLRRAIRYGKILNLPKNFLTSLAEKVIEIYQETYPEIKSKEVDILTIIQKEQEKFEETLDRGEKEFKYQITKFSSPLKAENRNLKVKTIPGDIAFDLYQSYGFPLELIKELADEQGFNLDEKGFLRAQKKHREISRAGKEKKFGGGGKFSPKLHTATHLLQAALRKVLGEDVKQMGSDITFERLRFDFFRTSQKMTEQEIKRVEDLVNQKITEDLEVKKEEMSYKEAIELGALAFFREKYPEKVTVYSINNFSKEICAGPHVKRTSELGKFKIIKEESSGSGVRRIRAILK